MHIAVAIVGFRNPEDIMRCLAALSRCSHDDFEVVVVENGGPEAFERLNRAVARQLPAGQKVTLVPAAVNLGFAGGINVALKVTPSADGWWILNPDTEPAPDALELLVCRLQRGDADAVGCTLYLPNGKIQSHGGSWQPWLARAISIGHGTPAAEVASPLMVERRQNYLNGASMLIARRFLEVAGPMKEDYFLYCEEVEWCLRARRSGLKLAYAEGAVVLHHQGTTTGNNVEFKHRGRMPVFLNERNKILLTHDCFPIAIPMVVTFSLIYLLYRYPRRAAWRQLFYALEGWWAGVVGQRGPPAWSPQ